MESDWVFAVASSDNIPNQPHPIKIRIFMFSNVVIQHRQRYCCIFLSTHPLIYGSVGCVGVYGLTEDAPAT